MAVTTLSPSPPPFLPRPRARPRVQMSVTVLQPNSVDRLAWFKAFVTGAASHGIGSVVWDDDGWFKLYDRDARTWDQGVLAAIGL